ncbi:MAG: protein kinase [Myxococcales bacterium]|nr:protein kinase [Myxococcales bacterium]
MTIPGLDPESAFPERLGRYEVLLPIASGGMGRVFLACSTAMGGFEREVAIKITHEHLRDNLQFFTALIDEARLAGRIRHPNVVSVLDVGEAPDGVFVVMDYVEGESLAGLSRLLAARGQSLPLEIALRVLDDVLSGLHAAHELTDADGVPLSVVHRDVTPHNVLIGIDGVSRITDFGVAKAASRLTKTMTGVVKGKIAYMAPEQARTGPVDRTCDVWGVGVMAWELFSGQRMHEGLNDYALLLKVSKEPPPRLRHVRPELPRAFDEALAGALSMRPSDRYPTAEAFAEALASAARQAGVFPADARAVKAFLAPLLLPGLEARRESAARIRRQRLGGSIGDVERHSRPSAPRIEVRSPGSEPYASVPRVEIPLPSAPRSSPLASAATVTDAIGPSAPPSEALTQLAATVVEVAPKARSRAWLAGLALIVVSVVGVAVSMTRSSGNPSAESNASPAPRPAPAASSASLPVVTPAELPVEAVKDDPADATAISPDDLGLEPGAAAAGRRFPRAPALAPSVYAPPEPRANPYKR